MKNLDLIRDAVKNTLRSKTRTLLTVVAIFIGAFTLTLTSGVGTGINAYIDQTVSSIGAGDVMTVTKTIKDAADSSAPRTYDPNAAEQFSTNGGPLGGPSEVQAITPPDLDKLAGVDGVRSVQPTLAVKPDYVQYDGGTQYQATVGGFVPGMSLELAAGRQPAWKADDYQIALPSAYVKPLGYSSSKAAIGTTVALGVTAADGTKSTVTAKVVGISEAGLAGGSTLAPNDALTHALYDAQSVGLTESARTSYSQAVVRFDPAASDSDVTALKDRLTTLGYSGSTVEDQIGAFRTVIDVIVLILNGFAIIALLAAGFGIVNTLLMSVQERTREIGLMKAMGMSGGKIFGVFSAEAVFIGLLGSAIGAGVAMLSGTLLSGALSGNLFAALPGLSIVAFDPSAIGLIVLTVMALAFLAGTIPALKAARKDPIDALRYE
ncbi:MAG TPA: ABC transporter permease [Pseudolysinimonas sp.]|nr:ABC transporter permease [Pseudolysinimonas sp.]